MTVIKFPVEPRIGWISPTGEFLGWAVSVGTKARAAYVVFVDGAWRPVE